jgi:hypothetical protein
VALKNREGEDAKLQLSIELEETKAKLMLAENKWGIVRSEKEECASRLCNL